MHLLKMITLKLAQIRHPVTLSSFAAEWLERRKVQSPSWRDDDSHLRVHVLPALGGLRLHEVRPKLLVKLISDLRASGAAPRTVRNVYSTVKSMFRDAVINDLVAASPCILGRPHLGAICDQDPAWRDKARFTRGELELLLSDPKLPEDYRMLFSILALAGLRFGEAAALRFRHIEAAEPLDRICVVASWDTHNQVEKGPKGGHSREVPVHPTLSRLLEDWWDWGWRRIYKRAPVASDLVVPSRRGPLVHRNVKRTWNRLDYDLDRLRMRARRVHDFRRTLATMMASAGAPEDRRRWILHGRPLNVLGMYTDAEWFGLSEAVGKVQLSIRRLRAV